MTSWKCLNAISLFIVTMGLILSVTAQSGGPYQITRSVIGGGGGASSGGSFDLQGTIGESVAGTTSTGGMFTVGGGFWGIGTNSPTASYSISGRVTTPIGLGLRNAIVFLTDSQGGVMRATTSSFGLYSFQNIPLGNYFVGVSSKRYRFATRSVALQSDLTNLNFVGLE